MKRYLPLAGALILGTVIAKNEKQFTGLKVKAEPNVLAVKTQTHAAPNKLVNDFRGSSDGSSDGTSEDSWNDRVQVQRRGHTESSKSSNTSSNSSKDRIAPAQGAVNRRRHRSWDWDVKKAPIKDNATSSNSSSSDSNSDRSDRTDRKLAVDRRRRRTRSRNNAPVVERRRHKSWDWDVKKALV